MRIFSKILTISIIAISFFSCNRNHYIGNAVQYYSIARVRQSDQAISNTVAPYKRQVDLEMNRIIGTAAAMLTKEQPESSLGNWSADAVLTQCELYSKSTVDFAILNYGGLRISSIAAGDITKGKIFELMPFDNMLVILEMQGSDLKALFEHIAANGGWPVSKAIQLKINAEGKALDVKINGRAIDHNKTYKIATIDYLANGGDNCSFFNGKARLETGRFLRDAVIEYVENMTTNGQAVSAKKEGRIIRE